MGRAAAVIVIVLIITLLIAPIIPTESCSSTTTDASIMGYKVGEKTTSACSPTSTSVLGIFLKGLK